MKIQAGPLLLSLLLQAPAFFLFSCRSSPGPAFPGALPPGPLPPLEAGLPLSLGGTFTVPLVLPAGEVRGADADGDGRWDLLLQDRVLLQGPGGSFQESRDLPWPRPEAFLVCDWDGDGKEDLLSARPLLHWWKGGGKGLFPLEDQGALLTSRGETLAPPRPWNRGAAILEVRGKERPGLVLAGPEGLALYLRDEAGRIRKAGFLLGPGNKPFRPARPTSLAGFEGPEGRPMLALFDGTPPSLVVFRVKKGPPPFRLEEWSRVQGPFPGIGTRAEGPGPLAAWKTEQGRTLLLAGPTPRLFEVGPLGLRPLGRILRERTRELRLPGQAYPLLARGPGGIRFLAGPGCFFYSGYPPAGRPGPVTAALLPGIPFGAHEGGVLLLEPGPEGRTGKATWEGKEVPAPILPPLLPLSRPALGDLDGDGIADLAGFPREGGFLTFWKGKRGGGFGPPLVLEVSPEVKASLPTVLSARGPGLALSLLPEREDLFAQVEVERPGPGPWSPGLLLRFKDEKNFLLLRVQVSRDPNSMAYRVSLVEVLGGRKRILAAGKGGPPDGGWHTLAASLVGGRVRAWWDGSYLAEGRTGIPGPAAAGLSAGKGRAHFRNFRVLPPPGSSPAGKPLSWKDTLLGRRKVLGGSWHLLRDLPEPLGGILFSRPGPGRPGPALFAADWDRDGDLDLLVSRPGFPLMWLEQARPLEFEPARALRLATGKPIHTGPLLDVPAAADLDGDGRLDLLVGDGLGRVLWYPGRSIRPVKAAASFRSSLLPSAHGRPAPSFPAPSRPGRPR